MDSPNLPALGFGLLSGEIRNRIYSLCFDPAVVVLAPTSDTKLDSFCPKPSDRRQFFAFTQTCRQIRAEFLPWYTQRTQTRIAIRNLTEYLRSFFPLRSSEVMAKYIGRFIVVIDWDEFEEVDLLRLIMLQLNSPKVDCRFGSRYEGLASASYWGSRANDLNALFARPTSAYPNFFNVAVKRHLAWDYIHSIRVSKTHESEMKTRMDYIKIVFCGQYVGVDTEDLVEVDYPGEERMDFLYEAELMDMQYFNVIVRYMLPKVAIEGYEPS